MITLDGLLTQGALPGEQRIQVPADRFVGGLGAYARRLGRRLARIASRSAWKRTDRYSAGMRQLGLLDHKLRHAEVGIVQGAAVAMIEAVSHGLVPEVAVVLHRKPKENPNCDGSRGSACLAQSSRLTPSIKLMALRTPFWRVCGA